ncbi:MAG TPA: DEAD/DEAH box helicase, partial [Syntrophaceae bacterium]|nr:DEAD/DEAH box helicase [Syntrophaceae bacterium]
RKGMSSMGTTLEMTPLLPWRPAILSASVILRAPTGSGKSEAAFMPFLNLRGKTLPNRMIYTLPMRALGN